MANPLSNRDVSEKLERIAVLLQLTGENEFKAIAFDKAARLIEGLKEPVQTYIESRSLETLKGIGKSIAQDLYTYAETGKIPVLEELQAKIPASLMGWLEISGMGPKKIYKVWKELGITELTELKTACADGRIASLSGFGAKSAEKILKSISWMEQFASRCRLDEAALIGQHFLDALKNEPGVEQISLAGSLRRSLETIGDIDVLIGGNPGIASYLFDKVVALQGVTEVLSRGETKCSVRANSGRQVDVRVVETHQFAPALMYFTGSKEHNIVMRQRARDRGMVLNEYGLFFMTADGGTDFSRPVPFDGEAGIFRTLGLGWVPPELREDRGEFAWFGQNERFPQLEKRHIKGILHAHSTWSDGKHTIAEMAQACIDRGYEYLGLTDHSRSAGYAGGLSIERVHAQWKEIDALNDQFAQRGDSFRIFKGIESDILLDGSLDYPDDVLAGFDFVIASVHSSLDMEPDKMLERFRKAAENRFTTIIGHPTGRLLLKREGNPFDMNALIDCAASAGTAIEINASPWRLDLDWRFGQKAHQTGLLTAICPDAHETDGIDDVTFGVGVARKAWFEPERVLNTLTTALLAEHFAKRR
jgi:DNA polymerase (family 10)